MSNEHHTHERLRELMLDELASGLSPEEHTEHERLSAGLASDALELESHDAERAVAATAVTLLDNERSEADAVPPGLLASLRAAAADFDPASIGRAAPPATTDSNNDNNNRQNDHKSAPAGPESAADEPDPVAGRIGIPAWAWGGWLAAAASLAVALIITNQQQPAGSPLSGDPVARLAAAPDVVTANFASIDKANLAPEPHPLAQSVGGSIKWADSADAGEMRIAGVEPNDPEEFQYQLWIFDAERPQGDYPGAEGLLSQFPVDGGVFNVTDEGEVIVPVQAKLPVGKAALFAITKEPPGGVVVSDREIVFVAALEN